MAPSAGASWRHFWPFYKMGPSCKLAQSFSLLRVLLLYCASLLRLCCFSVLHSFSRLCCSCAPLCFVVPLCFATPGFLHALLLLYCLVLVVPLCFDASMFPCVLLFLCCLVLQYSFVFCYFHVLFLHASLFFCASNFNFEFF